MVGRSMIAALLAATTLGTPAFAATTSVFPVAPADPHQAYVSPDGKTLFMLTHHGLYAAQIH